MGRAPLQAVIDAGMRHFRPIVPTSPTISLGLSPVNLETSSRARFLVPMGVSLGFDVLFVTVMALVLVPAV